jgi:hypothetical protein
MIEVYRDRKWSTLVIVPVDSSGRFSLATALPSAVVKLRAYVPSVGHSKAITTSA